MGYSWTSKIRITPADGAVTTITLSTAFAWVGGPVKIDLAYEPDTVQRVDVNQEQAPWVRGWRPKATLFFEIGSTMADQAYLAQILNALANPTTLVELTLDGATWRKVVLGGFKGPTPIGAKTINGAKYELALIGAGLIDEYPTIGSGTW